MWIDGQRVWRVGGALLCAVTAGCTGAPTGVSPASDEGDPDAEWEYQGSEAEPEWTADEVAAALDDALADPMPIPDSLIQTYAGVLAQGDSRCPGSELSFEKILGCTSNSGWWYAGIGGYEGTDGVESDVEIIRDALYADMQALSPAGQRFAMGGAVYQQISDTPDGLRFYSGTMEGIFIYTDGSILDPAMDALIRYNAVQSVEGRRKLTIDGALGHLGHHLEFNELVIGGETCPDGAVGKVGIRDETDHWYTVDLGERCDGSGEVTFNGDTSLGTVQLTEVYRLGDRMSEALLTPWR